ncbi:Protein-L-isoaspartate O-methyltransferase domain-containing protein 1, partial [Armadillidium vulgare]
VILIHSFNHFLLSSFTGPTGINHGVELHGDVVEYARERLAWFLANTGSVDVSFFCEPQFSQGNALCIKEEKMLYDRVYCGASCPSSHENYMKNLIKVNGILVMPRNDKLLKIVRTGENSWSSESLLPVSFSSLIMPDNSINAEEVQLPSVNLISLQELSREAIRKHFRDCIEKENESLKNAFIYTIPPKPSPKSRKTPMSCLNGNHPKVAMSDTENDTDDSEARDGEWERLSSSQSLHESMHSAFLELARSFINRGTRETSDGNNDLVEEQEGEEDVEVEVEEEEENQEEVIDYDDEETPFNENEGGQELFIGNGHDIIVRIIERVNRRPRPQNATKNNSSSKETSTNQNSKKDSESVDNPSTSSSATEVKSDTNNTECNNSNNKNKKTKYFNFDNSDDEMKSEDKEKTSEKTTKDNNSVHSSNTEAKPTEEMMDANSSQKSENPLKDFTEREFKKREKFDSGIVEDLDQAMSIDSSSSCSLKSRSNSESSLSEGSNRQTTRNDGDSDSLDGGLGSSQSTARSQIWKSRVKGSHRRKKRTIRYDNESKTDSSVPVEKYSQLMKEKIRLLPLPLPLKVYVNYNRTL